MRGLTSTAGNVSAITCAPLSPTFSPISPVRFKWMYITCELLNKREFESRLRLVQRTQLLVQCFSASSRQAYLNACCRPNGAWDIPKDDIVQSNFGEACDILSLYQCAHSWKSGRHLLNRVTSGQSQPIQRLTLEHFACGQVHQRCSSTSACLLSCTWPQLESLCSFGAVMSCCTFILIGARLC